MLWSQLVTVLWCVFVCHNYRTMGWHCGFIFKHVFALWVGLNLLHTALDWSHRLHLPQGKKCVGVHVCGKCGSAVHNLPEVISVVEFVCVTNPHGLL